ncbi:hypothetical protein CANARDRAFT_21962 [[Candida] arabinofermentans NRRL YB-2248]|uniref:Uncharacterized protein n=1 Tax=[Candida] arabinofermentans NRRL YB-2248 TaxID=983967 RepID=A0A1E4T5H1_9ASCO|nr:hypothetical protein CANARDRAFT_21962 [[Candida] arabinofermentans NRRL YB-2248]
MAMKLKWPILGIVVYTGAYNWVHFHNNIVCPIHKQQVNNYTTVMVPPGSPPSNYTVIKDANPQIMWYKYCTKLMRMVDYYDDRNLPHYLISKTEVTLVLLSFILNFLVLVTISLLLMRTIHNLVYNRTTIEGWEQEKVETQIHTERFWRRVRSNYQRLHGRPLPTLTSWVTNYKTLRANDIIPANFCYDDIVFPYTLNSILQNLELGLGDISTWIWPWGSPNGDGINFAKNTEDEDQLNLPWPPDGSDRLEIAEFQQEISKTSDGEEEVVTEKWANFLGETLDDFGVDLETESYELPKLK